MLGKKQKAWLVGFGLTAFGAAGVYSVVDDWDVITHAPQGTFTELAWGLGAVMVYALALHVLHGRKPKTYHLGLVGALDWLDGAVRLIGILSLIAGVITIALTFAARVNDAHGFVAMSGICLIMAAGGFATVHGLLGAYLEPVFSEMLEDAYADEFSVDHDLE